MRPTTSQALDAAVSSANAVLKLYGIKDPQTVIHVAFSGDEDDPFDYVSSQCPDDARPGLANSLRKTALRIDQQEQDS